MRRTLPTEVLLAAGGHHFDRIDGTDDKHLDSYYDLVGQLEGESTWSDELLLGTLKAIGQTDERALRTALVVLAGSAVGWINSLDRRNEVAA